jgi:NCAIR mutase (PurE)-related protein
MDADALTKILKDLHSGKTSIPDTLEKLKSLPYEDISFARVDHHRALRQGIPEVVFAQGKRPEEVVAIARSLHKKSGRVLITKATEAIHRKLRIRGADFHAASGVIAAGGKKRGKGSVLVISAGTSDIPVAEEAAETARFLGSRVKTLYDVGVAGLHRVVGERKALDEARAIIVVAGMEGALPSVVGGLTGGPIIAVPTSVGYGTSLGGLTALFGMLNSCVPGIAVMNIDNGFGAGALAHKINMTGL